MCWLLIQRNQKNFQMGLEERARTNILNSRSLYALAWNRKHQFFMQLWFSYSGAQMGCRRQSRRLFGQQKMVDSLFRPSGGEDFFSLTDRDLFPPWLNCSACWSWYWCLVVLHVWSWCFDDERSCRPFTTTYSVSVSETDSVISFSFAFKLSACSVYQQSPSSSCMLGDTKNIFEIWLNSFVRGFY